MQFIAMHGDIAFLFVVSSRERKRPVMTPWPSFQYRLLAGRLKKTKGAGPACCDR
jgi:hypothetical protein